MAKKKVSKEDWSGHLMPLLNDNCRTAAARLEAGERGDYDTLKEELISTSAEHARRAGETFWTASRKKGQSFPHYARVLTRLISRFATGETIRDALDKVVLEKFIQSLPRPAAINVRENIQGGSKTSTVLLPGPTHEHMYHTHTLCNFIPNQMLSHKACEYTRDLILTIPGMA